MLLYPWFRFIGLERRQLERRRFLVFGSMNPYCFEESLTGLSQLDGTPVYAAGPLNARARVRRGISWVRSRLAERGGGHRAKCAPDAILRLSFCSSGHAVLLRRPSGRGMLADSGPGLATVAGGE